jgi:glycosyltransferase involved in cell wall biosynthesis
LFYANYNARLFFYLLQAKVDIIVANDLDTLVSCWLAAKIRRKVLVFDSHELFTEVPELADRPLIKGVWGVNEKLFIRGVDFGYTVSKPIQEYYLKKYNSDFTLVRNVGLFRFENNHQFNGQNKIIIYQGALNKGRGIELMLNSMQYLDEFVLWIVGDGDIVNELKELAVKLGLGEKAVFIGRVPLDSLYKYTSKAYIGVSLEEDLGLNYRYALPNKIFDYIQARVPVVVSDLPEMKNLVKKYKIGEALKNRSPKELADTIKKLSEKGERRKELNRNLELAARDLCWQREEEKIILLYRKASEQALQHNA